MELGEVGDEQQGGEGVEVTLHEGAQKKPARGERVGSEAVGRRRSLDFAQELGGIGIALGGGLREVATGLRAVAE